MPSQCYTTVQIEITNLKRVALKSYFISSKDEFDFVIPFHRRREKEEFSLTDKHSLRKSTKSSSELVARGSNVHSLAPAWCKLQLF